MADIINFEEKSNERKRGRFKIIVDNTSPSNTTPSSEVIVDECVELIKSVLKDAGIENYERSSEFRSLKFLLKELSQRK